jgi:predicted nucleic acid-binding protein
VRFLLDTTAASQLGRARAPAAVRDWLEATREEDMAMSVMSLGEMREGIERLRPRDRDTADVLDARLDAIARTLAGRVISVTSDITERWGEMQAARGPLPLVDSLIAATAQAYGLQVVTRNVADFERCGVGVVDPWAGGA